MVFRAAEKRRFQKEEETADAAIGLLQLCDCFFFFFTCSKHRTNHLLHHKDYYPETTTTKNKSDPRTLSETSMSSVQDHRIAKAKPSMRDMHGQSRRRATTGGGMKKKKSMKPEIIAAQDLLQLCGEKNNFNKDLLVSPENCLKRYHMSSIDKFKVEDEEDDQHVDEGSKSDVSYITDDCSDLETTLAEITAAQQIMELSNSQQQATTTAEEEESTGYNKADLSAASSSIVSSKRKDLEEENNSFLPRKRRKFRSLAELYETTHPLEDLYFD